MKPLTRCCLLAVAALTAAGTNELAAKDATNLPGPVPRGLGPRTFGPIQCTDYDDPVLFAMNAGLIEAITFQEVPPGTTLGTQYPDVTFPDGDDVTLEDGSIFLEDTFGVDCNLSCNLTFRIPSRFLGIAFPGAMTIDLYDEPGGTLLYSSQDFAGSGAGFFGGVVCNGTFGAAEIRDWFNLDMFIDDVLLDGGEIFIDGFESGDTSAWSTTLP